MRAALVSLVSLVSVPPWLVPLCTTAATTPTTALRTLLMTAAT
jgi:hypothetical protein